MTTPKLGLVALRDRECRTNITKSLRRLGWTVNEHASGFHIIQMLSEVIIGDAGSPRPDLVVVDAISPGCWGVTIAAGFRDLGLAIPVIVIGPGEVSPAAVEARAHGVTLVDPAAVSVMLVAIAGSAPTRRGAPSTCHHRRALTRCSCGVRGQVTRWLRGHSATATLKP